MGLAIKNISIKLFLLLMAFQVINLSVDSVDFDPIDSPNTSAFNFNYYNSLVEYISESVMGHTNAFPEYQNDSNQSKSQLAGKHISIKLFQIETLIPIPVVDNKKIIHYPNADKDYTFLYSKEINQPPSIA